MNKNNYKIVTAWDICNPENGLTDFIKPLKIIEKRVNPPSENTREKKYVFMTEEGFTIMSLAFDKDGSVASYHFKLSRICKDYLENEIKLLKNNQLENETKSLKKEVNGERFILRKLILKDGKSIDIEQRGDGYINVTKLCEAKNKFLNDWKRNKTSKEYVQALFLETGIPVSKILTDGQGKNYHTFAHPLVAVRIAQWCCVSFSIQVDKWIYELSLTGRVELGKEKSVEELDVLNREQIKQLQEQLTEKEEQLTEKEEQLKLQKKEIKRLFLLNERNKKKHSYTEFKTSKCFYIIYNPLEHQNETIINRYKIGIGNDFNERLSTHRTTAPYMKVVLILYTEENSIIEKNVITKFKDFLNPNNHEFIEGVRVDIVIQFIRDALIFLSITYTFEDREVITDYNELIDSLFSGCITTEINI